MNPPPLISICIPAYQRVAFLRRLLDSIAIQSYRNFEVIVSDDTPGSEVEEVCKSYKGKFDLAYYQNETPQGTPENWNLSMRRANGEWIKLMHDDDWFADQHCLQQFADAIQRQRSVHFFFSAYNSVAPAGDKKSVHRINTFRLRQLNGDPLSLIAKNVIGPPSVVIHRNKGEFYDRRFKWLVDIDYYITFLQQTEAVYVPKVLVNIGLSEGQVTNSVFRNASVEIPEYFLLLAKRGERQLRDILVFDAWWRLMRNLNIRSVEDIRDAGYPGPIPATIESILRNQNRVSPGLLKSGIISKTLMWVCFLRQFGRRD